MFDFNIVGIGKMKIKSIQKITLSYSKENVPPNDTSQKHFTPNFGASPKAATISIDKFLNNKFVKGTFKFADNNPFGFTVGMLALTCIIMRPPTILIVPGSSKPDRQYAAGKSVIASIIANTARILLCLPLGKAILKLGEKAQEGKNAPDIKNKSIEEINKYANAILKEKGFYPKNTPHFDAINFAISNGFALILAIATSALLVKAVSKIMPKLFPPNENNKNETNPSTLNEKTKYSGGANES